MSVMGDIKEKIKERLELLVTEGILGEVQVDNAAADVFERDIGNWPCAIVTTPSTQSDYFQNTQNTRTHNFEIIVVQKQENVSSQEDIENLIEAILDKFDTVPSLSGAATGGVEPTSSPVEKIPAKGGTYIAFAITLKCRVIKDLIFE
jgi:hypothetical protein